MTTAIAAIDAERNRWLAAWETTAIQLSLAIAEKLLHRELSLKPELAQAAIIEALDLAADSVQITVRMNPSDVKNLGTWTEHSPYDLPPGTYEVEFPRLGEEDRRPTVRVVVQRGKEAFAVIRDGR